MTTSSKSWGHAISLLPQGDWHRRHACVRRNCDQLATHLCVYNYVTGQQGRVSWATRSVCDVHAERFRTKHDLPEPEVAPAPRHALQRLLEGGES